SLMRTAFSANNPVIVLDDLSTDSGKNIQQGYMDIFAGSMTGIRNPKAHGNVQIDSKRAIHMLFLASHLLYIFDERL
ncbi:MAG: TIGR02391 family protein, partial [Verrucomicrobiota bacterium]